VQLLGLRRPPLQEPHRHQDEQRELQVLGLPVLEEGGAEVGGDDVTAERHVRVAVAVLVLVEVGVAGDRLEHDRGQEQCQERHRQPVVLEELAHGYWCSSPITE
jgi:hypothetical protein